MTKAIRTRAAIFLAVFYASVMLAPAAALALDAVKVLHCVNDVSAKMPAAHDHDAAAAHDHGQAASPGHEHATGVVAAHDHVGKNADRDSSSPPIACCGLFSIAGMAADERLRLGIAPRVTSLMPLAGERRDGEGPGNITKPPKA